jgi:hypothetical protein
MNQQVLGRFQKGLAQYHKDFIHYFLSSKILMEHQVIETIPAGLNSVLLGFHTGLLLWNFFRNLLF